LREAHVRRLDDVRVTERACCLRFVHEALDDVCVTRQVVMEDLDRDAPFDQRVFRQEHRTHATGTERLDDSVAALDHVPRLDHHIACCAHDSHREASYVQSQVNNP
jgi:hypothetical protein